MDDSTKCIFRCELRDLQLSEIAPSDEILQELIQLMNVKDLSVFGTISWEKALLIDGSTTILEDLEKIRKIHVAGAMTKSSLYQDMNDSDRMKLLKALLTTEDNNFFGLVSYYYLSNLLPKIDFSEYRRFVEPFIASALSKPWKEQNLASFYLLCVVQEIFPESVTPEFLKDNLGTSEIFCPESVNHICNIVMDISENVDLLHPIFDIIAKKLLASNLVEEFFNGIYIVKHFMDTQYRVVTFLLTEILKDLNVLEIIPNILPIDYIEQSMSMYEDVNSGQDTKILIEKLYRTFISRLNENGAGSEVMVKIFKKILFIDGRIKKIGGTIAQHVVLNTIRLLPINGIKEIADILKAVILGNFNDDFREVQCALTVFVYFISQSYLHEMSEWTVEQFTFLQKLCFLKDQSNKHSEALASLLEFFFYWPFVLVVKMPKSNDSRRYIPEVLSKIVTVVDESNCQTLRWPLIKPIDQQNWTKVLEIIKETEDSSFDKNTVFRTFALWFAFRLLGRCKLHPAYFSELFSCYESAKLPTDNDDFVWTKIVDLVLVLLSRDNYPMKLIISDVVFPVVCEHMSRNVLFPILYLLNPTTQQIRFLSFWQNSEEQEKHEEQEHMVAAPSFKKPDSSLPAVKFLRTWQKTERAAIEYRIRIVNLIKMYLYYKPLMLQTLAVLSHLLRLLAFCLKDKNQKDLSKEIARCLSLFPLIEFSESKQVKEKFLVILLRTWLFTKSRCNKRMTASIVDCSICILNCSQLLNTDDEEISESEVEEGEATLTQLTKDALLAFLLEKCNIPYKFLKAVFKSNWTHVDTCTLVQTMFFLLFAPIVPAKRIKCIKLLKLFFRNRQYIESHREEVKPIEQVLGAFLQKWVGFFKKLNGKGTERVEEIVSAPVFKYYLGSCRKEIRSRETLIFNLLKLFYAIKTSPVEGFAQVWPDLELEVREYCAFRTTHIVLQKKFQ